MEQPKCKEGNFKVLLFIFALRMKDRQIKGGKEMGLNPQTYQVGVYWTLAVASKLYNTVQDPAFLHFCISARLEKM